MSCCVFEKFPRLAEMLDVVWPVHPKSNIFAPQPDPLQISEIWPHVFYFSQSAMKSLVEIPSNWTI